MSAKIKKKDGTLTKKYRDMPRYNVIASYESDFKDGFTSVMGVAIKDFTRELKKKLKIN